LTVSLALAGESGGRSATGRPRGAPRPYSSQVRSPTGRPDDARFTQLPAGGRSGCELPEPERTTCSTARRSALANGSPTPTTRSVSRASSVRSAVGARRRGGVA
jgi:hypothetical protein